MTDPSLSTCGCCEDAAGDVAAPVNAPGLTALAWRVGTHSSFRQALLTGIAGEPDLRALATRDSTDASIALLDAWAVVLDVLSFYQERIANEAFLRTAVERRSVLELARAIGYELRPGVAASTCLAFTLDTAATSPSTLTLAVGTQAQSVPGQDETAQTFETVEEIEARPAWNELKPQLTLPSLPLTLKDTKVWLKGTATGLQVGDALLFIGAERKDDAKSDNWDFRRVAALVTVSAPATEGANAGYTEVTLDHHLGSYMPEVKPSQKDTKVYALRQRAAIFGYNAVDWNMLSNTVKAAYPGGLDKNDYASEWPEFELFTSSGGPWTLDLDAVYPKVIAGKGWLVLSIPEYQEVYRIESAVESSRAKFGLSGKTTLITLGKGENQDRFSDKLRDAVVYAQSEQLEFTDKPRTDVVEGGEIVIAPAVDGLLPGRLLAVTGKSADTGGSVSEVVEIQTAVTSGDTTTITLVTNLVGRYVRDGVTINANVARAMHGATTKGEILGSGDGSVAFQKLKLKRKPLTYVSAAVPGGAETTLELRVKGVEWHEAPSFHGAAAGDRSFVTRRADDGTVTVQFGDGRTGARLPTGSNNITATYRSGIGLDGNVDAGVITTLLSRPLGLKGVINPIAATGAGDPEELADARSNAPLTVLTLDRIVSVQDFEDFARAFSGIGKAQATLLWNGERRLVHLTVAASGGSAIDKASDLYQNLVDGIDAARHAEQPVCISPHVEIKFTLKARVATDEDLVRDDVLAEVTTALTDAFSFEARSFGQAVTSSEILAVMQRVTGVVAVDLDLLNGFDAIEHPDIPAQLAYWNLGQVVGAELVLVDPDGITFTELVT